MNRILSLGFVLGLLSFATVATAASITDPCLTDSRCTSAMQQMTGEYAQAGTVIETAPAVYSGKCYAVHSPEPEKFFWGMLVLDGYSAANSTFNYFDGAYGGNYSGQTHNIWEGYGVEQAKNYLDWQSGHPSAVPAVVENDGALADYLPGANGGEYYLRQDPISLDLFSIGFTENTSEWIVCRLAKHEN